MCQKKDEQFFLKKRRGVVSKNKTSRFFFFFKKKVLVFKKKNEWLPSKKKTSNCDLQKMIRTQVLRECYKLYFFSKTASSFENRIDSENRIEFKTWRFETRLVHRKQSKIREYKEEQIIETTDKPQCLVVQRLLSHLQYRDATKSCTKDLSLLPFNLMNSWH